MTNPFKSWKISFNELFSYSAKESVLNGLSILEVAKFLNVHDSDSTILTPNLPLSLPHYLSYGESEGDFAFVARRVVASCTATEGGGWVDSEFADLHCFLKEGHI